MSKEKQDVSLYLYNELIKYDDIKTGLRRHMMLEDVIQSYPEFHAGLHKLIMQRFGENRGRFYPYMASVVAGKEKWSPDSFYMGVKDIYKDEFRVWCEKFKNYIIDNEQLHEFWML